MKTWNFLLSNNSTLWILFQSWYITLANCSCFPNQMKTESFLSSNTNNNMLQNFKLDENSRQKSYEALTHFLNGIFVSDSCIGH